MVLIYRMLFQKVIYSHKQGYPSRSEMANIANVFSVNIKAELKV